MHILLRENLEGYLSGSLGSDVRQKVDAHLAACSDCREELDALELTAEAVRELRPPDNLELEPAASFYARVMERIDQEREVPFWALLLDPVLARRVAFACLMMLALLGAIVTASDQTDFTSQHVPEAILAGRTPGVLESRAPHFNSNLEHNRDTVLAALVTEGD